MFKKYVIAFDVKLYAFQYKKNSILTVLYNNIYELLFVLLNDSY